MADKRRNGKTTLREARDRRGLSREKVGAMTGRSSKTLERWEDPEKRPRHMKRYVLEELAEIYGINVDDLEEAAA